MPRIAALLTGLVLLGAVAQLQAQSSIKKDVESIPGQIQKPAPRETNKPAPSELKQETGIFRGESRRETRTVPLTTEERGLVFKALNNDATAADRQVANKVCKEKCQPCHDGTECNFECVRKVCIK